MNEYNRGFRSLKNARFNAWMYGLNAYNAKYSGRGAEGVRGNSRERSSSEFEAYPEYNYNYNYYYPFYGYPSLYPVAEWQSYQNYYQNYYQYYQYNYWLNNYNQLAANYNQLLVENKYLNNELEQETPNLPIEKIAYIQETPSHEYSEPIPAIEKEEFHPDIPREITLEQSEVTPIQEDTAYNTYHTFETYYTVDTYDIIPYSE